MENSKIEWTDHTFSPWRGCTKIAEGCKFCYADAMSKRNPGTLGVWGPQGKRVVAAESYWREPLKWDLQAARDGVRRKVFCASLADVFEDWRGPMVDSSGERLWHLYPPSGVWVTDTQGHADKKPITMQDVRNRLFDLIDRCRNLDFLLLTKRPENVLRMVPPVDLGEPDQLDFDGGMDPDAPWMRPNVWIGYSASTQEDLDRGLPHLLKVQAAVRFLSLEPLLGPMDLRKGVYQVGGDLRGTTLDGIGWVIVGGESGPNARPMHPDWARSIRDQCVAAGVPFFFKQFGEWAPYAEAGTCDMTEADILGGKMVWLSPSGEFSADKIRPQSYQKRTVLISRVGKKAAGRLLDGREWSEFPE